CPVRDNRSVEKTQARIFFTVPSGTECVCVNRLFSIHIPSHPGRWGRWCGVFFSPERLSLTGQKNSSEQGAKWRQDSLEYK
ncbi:MAG: hypothetical protein LBS46_04740, partial [Dysgonamonadaceae bacterium]|nr:hypothetical protein [Dysgonamonadaceae bacterium]